MRSLTVRESRYQTGALLGRGGMAEVYAGIDAHLGRPVAIKRLREDRAANPTLRARFRREASAAARLNHPGIVAVFDTDEMDPSAGAVPIPIIVMELVDGCTLREILRDGARLTTDRALEITAAVLDALAASHAAGIVHRDIKPANVLVTSTGQVKVADFGIARSVSDDSATETQGAIVMGSPPYMSPEQVRGLTVDHRSDLYSVGCLLHELLVGEPPFRGDSPLSIGYLHVTEPPVKPSRLDPHLHGDIDTIVTTALQKSPGDRYQTATQMRADIAAVRAGQKLSAPHTTATTTPYDTADAVPHPPAPIRPARNLKRVGILATAVVLILALASFGYLRSLTAQTQDATEVPAVLGFSSAQAESLLRNAHLVPRVQLGHGPATTIHTVIEQTPVGGDQVEPNSTVVIKISTGPAKATIPAGLVGLTTAEAKSRLKQAGFTTVTTKAAAVQSDVAAGTVTAVDPAEGKSGALDAPITLSYASTTGATEATTATGTLNPTKTSTSGVRRPPSSKQAKNAPDAAKPNQAAKAPRAVKAHQRTKAKGPSKKKTHPHPKSQNKTGR